jgi:hypothetical protein
MEQLSFPSKPALNVSLRQNSREVCMVSNFLKISFNPNENSVKIYSIKFEPEIESEIIQKQILSSNHSVLKNKFYPYLISGNNLFSPQKIDSFEFTYLHVKDEVEVEYRITIEKTKGEVDLSNIKTKDSLSIQIKNLIEIILKNIFNANPNIVRINNAFYSLNSCDKLKENNGNFF